MLNQKLFHFSLAFLSFFICLGVLSTMSALGSGPDDAPTLISLEDVGNKVFNRTALTVASQVSVDEVEPNDSYQQANSITSALMAASISPVGDVDYFSFSANAGDRLFMALESASSSASSDSYLEIFDRDGTSLLERDDDDGTFSLLSSSIAGLSIAESGTYYAKVKHASNNLLISPYDLHFKLQSGSPSAEVEPNNTTTNAQALPASGWVAGTIDSTSDTDLYSLNLNAGDSLYIALDMDPERDGTTFNGRAGLGLLSNTFVVANDGSSTSPNSEAFFLTIKEAGTYFVYVDASSGGGASATYHLSVDVQPKASIGTTCRTYSSSDVPLLLGPNGNNQTTANLIVPDASVIGDINLTYEFTHDSLSDLQVTLKAPNGQSTTLLASLSSSQFDKINIGLDDEAWLPAGAAEVWEGVVYQPSPPGRLSTFNGANGQGTWSLTFTDENDNNGTLSAFELELCDQPATSPPPPSPSPPPSNQPPQVSTPMPDITVVEGAADQTINPLNYFSDPDGDLFFLSVTGNSNPSVVPNLPEGHFLGNIDQMAIEFGEAGQTEITIQAKELSTHATAEDTFRVTVLERPNISISKSVSSETVSPTQQIIYTIAIANSGPSSATDALISDSLPTGLTFVSESISASGITTGTVGTTLPTLALGVTLLPSQTVEVSFAATVDQDVLANQMITNSAQVTSSEVITPVQASQLITTVAPTLAISDVTVSEGDPNAVFLVALSAASAVPVTVDFTSVEGSATAADCVPTSGTLTIAAGQTEGEITMQIIDDDLVEESETFSVQLSNAEGATIADGEAVGTINDNEDADGVNNDMEDQVPNLLGSGNGDGNGDGIPDSQQDNVASLPNGTNGDYVTFVASNDQTLNNVQAASTPADAPQEASFWQGIFSWNATGLSAGDATSITLILHGSDSANLPNSFWKYGPTPDKPTNHWYNFTFDGTTGAEISQGIITLHFVDGQRGDSDMTANGQISDPGGPAIYQPPTALTISDIDRQAPTGWYVGAFIALLIVSGLLLAIRRKIE